MSGGFQTCSQGMWTGHAVTDLPRDVLTRLVENPQNSLRSGQTKTIKDGDGVLVVRSSLEVGSQSIAIACKRVHRTSPLKRVTQALGPNRSLRSFHTGHRLLALGVATARPLAVIVPSRLHLAEPSWLVTEWLDQAENLAAFSRHCRQRPLREKSAWANAVAVALGRLLGRMHAAGVSHRDLKPQNLMVRSGACPQTVEVFTIDLDGVRFPWHLSTHRRWKNLSRLAIGERDNWPGLDRTARRRFLKAYIAATALRLDPKDAWRELSSVTFTRQARRAA